MSLTSWSGVVRRPFPRMLCHTKASILRGSGHGLCKVGICEEGAVRRADDTGASRRPAVLLRGGAPTVDHGAGDGAVQLTRARCRRLIQITQPQPRIDPALMHRYKRVRVSRVNQRHISICLVSFFLVLQTVRVQTQRAGDVAVRVRWRDGPWWRRRAN